MNKNNKEKYVAVCRDDKGNSVKINGLVAGSREEAMEQIKNNFNVREIFAVVTEKDAEFIRKTLNGEDDEKCR